MGETAAAPAPLTRGSESPKDDRTIIRMLKITSGRIFIRKIISAKYGMQTAQGSPVHAKVIGDLVGAGPTVKIGGKPAVMRRSCRKAANLARKHLTYFVCTRLGPPEFVAAGLLLKMIKFSRPYPPGAEAGADHCGAGRVREHRGGTSGGPTGVLRGGAAVQAEDTLS